MVRFLTNEILGKNNVFFLLYPMERMTDDDGAILCDKIAPFSTEGFNALPWYGSM